MINADPFSNEWNWANQKVQGRVKTITTPGRTGKSIEAYNLKGQKVLKESFDKDGKMSYKTVLKYNKDNDLNEVWFSKKASNEAMYVETAVYKSKGIINHIKNVRDGNVTESKEIKYDSNGLSAISIENRKRVMTWTFKFSKDKNLLESGMLFNGEAKGLSKYKNDDKGNPTFIENLRNGKVAATQKIAYDYDSQGNWVKQTITSQRYRDGKAAGEPRVMTKERTITYY